MTLTVQLKSRYGNHESAII